MIELTEYYQQKQAPHINGKLTLPIEQRVRSRIKAQLDDGRSAGIFLPRGNLLRGGDLLCTHDGLIIEVVAANETVTTVYAQDPTLLARAAYHLGNRHIPLQIENGWLRYQHDHVLDDMLQQMGIEICVEQAPFEPESGAYQQAPHQHHSHNHNHHHA